MNVAVKTAIALKRILFAVDYSSASLTAFPFAKNIARQYGGKVYLAGVTDGSGNAPMDPDVRSMLHQMLAGADEEVVAGASEIDRELVSDHGNLWPTLVSVAERSGFDLIVMGTYGPGGLKKLLRGSKAEQVMRLSSKPVLVVGPRVSRKPEFNRILYATDFSPAARNALGYADSFRDAYQASLVLMHVNDGNSDEDPVEATPNTLKFLQAAREQGYAGLSDSEMLVEFGPRGERIVEAAEARNIDLIVLGVQSKKGIKARVRAHLPGSLAYEVISRARCPVLTVPLPANP